VPLPKIHTSVYALWKRKAIYGLRILHFTLCIIYTVLSMVLRNGEGNVTETLRTRRMVDKVGRDGQNVAI
jgi:hypothetical protein